MHEGSAEGRNTPIIRSNSLWDGLAQELDDELLFDQRAALNLAHDLPDVHDGVWLDIDEVAEICPLVNVSPAMRYPVLGEPVLDCVVMSTAVAVHVSRARTGELMMGVEANMAAALELFPAFARADAPRSWAGSVDVTPDASPILGLTPLEGLFVNCGWGTGGLKVTPGAGRVYAETIGTGETHPLAEPFALERFALGAPVGGHRAAAVAH